MDIKILKLSYSEEIMGECSYNNGIYEIKNPVRLVMFPTEGGGVGMGLMQLIPYSSDTKVTIEEKFVIFTCKPSEDVVNEYRERFGSGIVTPKKEIII